MELKLGRKGLIIWSAVVFFTALMGIAEYPIVGQNIEAIISGMDAIPRVVRVMFGVDGLDFTEPIHYYLTMYYYYTLIVFIHAAHCGYDFIAKDQRDRLSDFLYTKPIRRESIIMSKLLAGIVHLCVMALVVAVTSVGVLLPVTGATDLTGRVLMTVVGLFLAQLMFFGFGAFCNILFGKYSMGSLISYLSVLITYGIAVVSELNGGLGVFGLFNTIQIFCCN